MPPPGHISKGRRAARLARERDFAMKLHAALLHVLQLRTPRLPPEVFDIIIGHALADMLGDLVVVPENLRVWEAGSVLLQVSSAFRTFTIKYLGPLWSGKFPVGNRRYKQTIMSCRRDSEYAHWWPHKFVCESKVPSVLDLPIVIIFKHIFSGVAYSLSNLKDSWRDGALQPYVLDELTAFIKAYSHLPHRTKSVLFARIEQYLEEEYIPWIRASMLERAIHILSRSLLLEVRSLG
ncbi:hypothetical protein OF83DRAFT_1105562 [Amylostereum chailletii]|nr:hypothetical protein OF83DRAFT_1105562 [Amylostereum chailletii]